jgi:hypothetical protein
MSLVIDNVPGLREVGQKNSKTKFFFTKILARILRVKGFWNISIYDLDDCSP